MSKRELTDDDELLIMASDGVWDVISDQKACDIVNKALKETPGKPHLAAKALCLGAYQAESEDNISASVLLFRAMGCVSRREASPGEAT